MKKLIYMLGISCCINFYIINGVNPRKSNYNNYVRCTRRFSPGMCVEAVSAVWTFVFQNQNCTERLGCPVDWRGNRFGTYESCMRRCIPLIEIYNDILNQDQNASYLRIKKFPKAIQGAVWDQIDSDEEEDYEVLQKRVSLEGPAPVSSDEDQDTDFKEIPDIDCYDNEDRKNNMEDDFI